MSHRFAVLSLTWLLLVSCTTPLPPRPPGPITKPAPAPVAVAAPAPEPALMQAPPRVDGIGNYSRPVSNASPEAQRWFDQGLNLLYGFNHDEAIRSFSYAAELSPDCAMCFWGIAYAHGPHINNSEVTPDHARAAFIAVQKAQTLASKSTPVERDLIGALTRRYSDPPPADRSLLDLSYAEAMRGVRNQHPTDADVVALTAEALMDLHPWDYYTLEGAPKPWTPEILEVTGAALSLAPEHPMANHILIHAVEASTQPGRAQRAADLLRDLQPGLGHMVHMPSHIDVRTGQWAKAIEANRRAINADAKYRAIAPDVQFYAIYMAHNHHMLSYAAMMSGRSADALLAISEMVDGIPAGFRAQATHLVDGYFALPLEAQMRFGKWDDILLAPDFDEDLPASRALRHAARGVALAAKGEVVKAREEQQLFEEARAKIPANFTMGQNKLSAITEIASHLLAGEILLRERKFNVGIGELKLAVEAEDRLRFSEPPDWIQPTRHALGAALTQGRKFKEAEAVFREDLRRTPGNGWALFGLAQSLRLQNKHAEAVKIDRQFQDVWSKADIELESACMCQAGR